MWYLGERVAFARKRLGVDLPSLYADRSEALKDKNKYLFNCYQRGHQNALETWPIMLFMLFTGGIKHPLIAAAAGFVWSFGRIVYAWGYSSDSMSRREYGVVLFLPALFLLIGLSVSTSVTLLQPLYS